MNLASIKVTDHMTLRDACEVYIGSTLATCSAMWAWLGTNHEQISAICAMIGAALALHSFYNQQKSRIQQKKRGRSS